MSMEGNAIPPGVLNNMVGNGWDLVASDSLVMWISGNTENMNDWMAVEWPLTQAMDEEDPDEDVTNGRKWAKRVKLDPDEDSQIQCEQ